VARSYILVCMETPFAKAEMAESGPGAVGALSARAAGEMSVVAADDERYCVKCTYPLRGLITTGTCPECGILVAPSLAVSTLANVLRR